MTWPAEKLPWNMPPGSCTCGKDSIVGHDAGCVLHSCPACGSSVGRRQGERQWRCDNGHVITREEA